MGSNPPQPGAKALDAREFVRYVTASVVALGVDVLVLYLLAVRLGIDAPVAGTISYVVGLAVHYVLAVSRVFAFRRLRHAPSAEFALYAASGAVGAGVSYVILSAGEHVGAWLWYGKAVAVAVAFVVTYLLRRRVLFTRTATDAP